MLRLVVVAAIAVPIAAFIAPPAANAATRCPSFSTWEELGGTRRHASISFKPVDLCNGRHVKRAYVVLSRSCWPAVNTGRVYTASASSPSSSSTYSISKNVWDSPVWSCNTNAYYGWDYF